MSTVGKALALLDIISRAEKSMGLSEIARSCGTDKATARRLLVELGRHGFVEQDAQTRKYDLGPSPVRLARIRATRFPFVRIGGPVANGLVDRLGETIHLSRFAGERLATVHVAEPAKAIRVSLDVGTILPLHATASGLAFLAACPEQAATAYLGGKLEAFTKYTVTDPGMLAHHLSETRNQGYSVCVQGLEEGTISAAAAIQQPGSQPLGTIAIAAPLIRVDESAIHAMGEAVADAAATISARYFALDADPTPRPGRSE